MIDLTTIVPDGQLLTVDELAPLDQFHIGGMLATAELASAAGVEPSTHALERKRQILCASVTATSCWGLYFCLVLDK